MKTTALIIFAYVAGIVLANFGFERLPIFNTPLGVLPAMTFFVGFIFVLRDFAQRRLGHWKVVPLMVLGSVITWFTVSETLALASVAAFTVSEVVDWLVYTVTKRKFEDRVLLSSALSTPVDSLVFLGMIGFLSVGGLVIMTISKMAVSVALWAIWRKYKIDSKLNALGSKQ